MVVYLEEADVEAIAPVAASNLVGESGFTPVTVLHDDLTITLNYYVSDNEPISFTLMGFEAWIAYVEIEILNIDLLEKAINERVWEILNGATE